MTITPGSGTPSIELASVADALAALDHATSAVRAAEVSQVLAIAAVCDLHRVDESKLVAGCERWIDGGADGTPQIGEFIAAEIGALLGISPTSALVRIAQVLNVRHRHPVLWAAVTAGEIRFYDAGRVADVCAQAGLGVDACLWLDHQCALALLTQPWSRVRNQVGRWILRADPALAAERARRLAEARRVEVSPIIDGHCELWGRLDAADGLVFDQALDAIADTLPSGAGADETGAPVAARMSRDRRRAAAVGILARQALGQPELPRPAELIVRVDAVASLEPVGTAEEDCHAVDGSETDPGTFATCGTAAADRAAPAGRLRLSPVAEIQGWGPVLTTQLGEILAGCRVIVRPVIDTARLKAVDSYQIPDTMRLAVTERWPVDAFPYGTHRSTACDLDHSTPYSLGGRTEVANLAPLNPDPLGGGVVSGVRRVAWQGRDAKAGWRPVERDGCSPGCPAGDAQQPQNGGSGLTRFAHRARTHGGWKLEQTEPGRLTWTSPHGYSYTVTPTGTLRIGRPPPTEYDWSTREPPHWLDAA